MHPSLLTWGGRTPLRSTIRHMKCRNARCTRSTSVKSVLSRRHAQRVVTAASTAVPQGTKRHTVYCTLAHHTACCLSALQSQPDMPQHRQHRRLRSGQKACQQASKDRTTPSMSADKAHNDVAMLTNMTMCSNRTESSIYRRTLSWLLRPLGSASMLRTPQHHCQVPPPNTHML